MKAKPKTNAGATTMRGNQASKVFFIAIEKNGGRETAV
jgi:hypothetical protein